MKRFKQVMGFVISFMFLFTLMPKNVVITKADTGSKLPAADLMAVLTGDFVKDQGLGNDWDPTNTGTIMKEFSKGIYELTVDFKTAKAYNYKVAFNGQWDNPVALGNDGQNIALNVTAPGKVTFRVDAVAQKVYDSINNPDQFKDAASVVGTLAQAGGKDWTPDDATFDLDYVGQGFFTKKFSLKAGTYEYKVAYGHKWSNGEVGDNVKFKLDKDQDVTFVGNPDLGICMDSVNVPSIATTISLIGTIRNADDTVNWQPDAKGYEFSYLTNDGKYVYSNFFKAGDYQYKGIENYSWDGGGLPSSGNVNITIPAGGKYVVFVVDRASGEMFDSINNADKVAELLGLSSGAPKPVEVKSPVINANGTVTFSYKNADAKAVYVEGDFTAWKDGKKAMKLDAATGVWSITLRLGDAAKVYGYKFIVDGQEITDPSNTAVKDGNSVLDFPQYKGRKVVIAGSVQAAAGEASWTPTSDKTAMNYDGNGLYSFTMKSVPAGQYEYKIAMNGWGENYGANGIAGGSNIALTVPTKEDVKFVYSDDSHYAVDSTFYKALDITLTGTGIPANTKLIDATLSGVYSVKVTLKKGTYKDLVVTYGSKKTTVSPITITSDTRDVTIGYDPVTNIVFSDASGKSLNTAAMAFDSRNTAYKAPYGAVKTGTKVTFNLKTAKDDATIVKLVLSTPDGNKIIDMKKNGSFDSTSDRWTAQYTFDKISQNGFYFVVSNGSDVKAYGDDTNFGVGIADDLGKVYPYQVNVYDKNFKTPDWLKNGVIYQIFPDRFFNGDTSNDTAQTTARGSLKYEYPEWNQLPENPNLEYDKDGNVNADYAASGAFIGDGKYNNDMFGGDLVGITDKIDYLQKLGVTILYLNPISQSVSTHRYDTTNYKNVDPFLGKLDDFVKLVKEADKRKMHIVLDGVFNHVSDDSVYFDRYGKFVAKGKPLGAYQYWAKVYDYMNSNSKLTKAQAEAKTQAYYKAKGITDFHYKDWFVVNNEKVTSDGLTHYAYAGWNGNDSMPEIQAINNSEYNVKTWDDEIIDGKNADSRYWLKEGASGWRLDAATNVSDETWQHFRTAVKSEGDNAIIGEDMGDSTKYLLGNMFDSVMNYRFSGTVDSFVAGTTTADSAMDSLEVIREQTPTEAFDAMMNLVDSHDTERVISTISGVDGSKIAPTPTDDVYSKMKMIPFIQMTYPGAPAIYYGDEEGLAGGNDPDDRRTFDWDAVTTGQGKILHDWYSQLASIRNSNAVLRTGSLAPITVDAANKADIMAYQRALKNTHAVVAVNRKTTAVKSLTLTVKGIANGTVLTNALNTSEAYMVINGKVTVNVPAQSGVILIDNLATANAAAAAASPLAGNAALSLGISLLGALLFRKLS